MAVRKSSYDEWCSRFYKKATQLTGLRTTKHQSPAASWSTTKRTVRDSSFLKTTAKRLVRETSVETATDTSSFSNKRLPRCEKIFFLKFKVEDRINGLPLDLTICSYIGVIKFIFTFFLSYRPPWFSTFVPQWFPKARVTTWGPLCWLQLHYSRLWWLNWELLSRFLPTKRSLQSETSDPTQHC